MITVRRATIEDLETIKLFNKKLSKKENEEFDKTVNPKFATTENGNRYFSRSIENDDKLALIAEDSGNPVGYLVGGLEEVSDYRNISSLCEIDNMWVDEKYRSQGIGRKFINEIESWAKEKGVKRMRVIASFQNEKGINFYKREGFKEYDLILEKNL